MAFFQHDHSRPVTDLVSTGRSFTVVLAWLLTSGFESQECLVIHKVSSIFTLVFLTYRTPLDYFVCFDHKCNILASPVPETRQVLNYEQTG